MDAGEEGAGEEMSRRGLNETLFERRGAEGIEEDKQAELLLTSPPSARAAEPAEIPRSFDFLVTARWSTVASQFKYSNPSYSTHLNRFRGTYSHKPKKKKVRPGLRLSVP